MACLSEWTFSCRAHPQVDAVHRRVDAVDSRVDGADRPIQVVDSQIGSGDLAEPPASLASRYVDYKSSV